MWLIILYYELIEQYIYIIVVNMQSSIPCYKSNNNLNKFHRTKAIACHSHTSLTQNLQATHFFIYYLIELKRNSFSKPMFTSLIPQHSAVFKWWIHGKMQRNRFSFGLAKDAKRQSNPPSDIVFPFKP